MEFSPHHPIVKLCLQGMALEGEGKTKEALLAYHQAWGEASDDFEKFLAAHFVARHQKNISDRLRWLETTLALALKVNDDAVRPAFGPLYERLADCHEALGNREKVKANAGLAKAQNTNPTDRGPFYHGTKADLPLGGLLTAGNPSNYQSGLAMNHVYFTALVHGAGLAAELAKGEGQGRVYLVEPTGPFENDPNVTNKKFPGNPTRSYRTEGPLKIIGEVPGWARQTPEELRQWREKLSRSKGDIIN